VTVTDLHSSWDPSIISRVKKGEFTYEQQTRDVLSSGSSGGYVLYSGHVDCSAPWAFPWRPTRGTEFDAHSHQDLRSYFHGNTDRRCQSDGHTRANLYSGADDATGGTDADFATDAHSWASNHDGDGTPSGAYGDAEAASAHKHA
jgi:hypothetical protein